MKIKPLGHRILIKPEEITKEVKTSSGITLYKPDQTVDLERAGVDRGIVVEIGPTAWLDPQLGGKAWCEVGDTVYWARYAGKPVTVGDITYHLVNDEDLICKEIIIE